ncbi:hypothetical protein VNO77_43735 [Canavalia gladiata]|uniref:Legume lectin domain-containing protein n=1 Tax=Canavalia gladiata TaxID=3824 RepID=A0AAN9PQA5_CANGL
MRHSQLGFSSTIHITGIQAAKGGKHYVNSSHIELLVSKFPAINTDRCYMRERERQRDRERESVVIPSKRRGMVTFSLFVFCSLIFLVQPSSSQHSPNFDPDIHLFGDAHIVVSDGAASHVNLTRPSHSSSGLLLRRKPLTFADTTSLSIEFSFSISPSAGDGLLLLLVPGDFSFFFSHNGSFGVSLEKKYVGVEFDTSKDENVGDVNANHVGIDVGSLTSVAVANVSSVNLALNGGKKLNAWVDYEAGSKVLEVRLSKWGEPRSSLPIVSHSIDFFKIWGRNPVFVGISSSNDPNSVQVVSVYSWNVTLRKVSNSLHSLPADPRGLNDRKTKFCPLTVLAGVIFGTGCLALVTFLVLFLWVIFFQRREDESLVKIPDHPSDIRYERIDVAVDKNTDDDQSKKASEDFKDIKRFQGLMPGNFKGYRRCKGDCFVPDLYLIGNLTLLIEPFDSSDSWLHVEDLYLDTLMQYSNLMDYLNLKKYNQLH